MRRESGLVDSCAGRVCEKDDKVAFCFLRASLYLGLSLYRTFSSLPDEPCSSSEACKQCESLTLGSEL